MSLSLHAVHHTLEKIAFGLPAEAFFVPLVILYILSAAALVDARTGRIPDPFILGGLLFLVTMDGLFVNWPFAASRLALGLGAAFALWAVNQLWFKAFGHDSIGMGDAKWTALAVAAFHIKPVLMAWFIGALLGIVWLALLWFWALLTGREKPSHIHFAPFLLIGLTVGLMRAMG